MPHRQLNDLAEDSYERGGQDLPQRFPPSRLIRHCVVRAVFINRYAEKIPILAGQPQKYSTNLRELSLDYSTFATESNRTMISSLMLEFQSMGSQSQQRC